MHVAILTTGGTIEKTYDERDGVLANVGSVLQHILSGLRLEELTVRHQSVMSKDSLHMTPEDRISILEATRQALPDADAVLIVHGTDTLAETGDVLYRHLVAESPTPLQRPVVLTGAMRPHEFRDTDAYQNVTEALLACRLLSPGVYVVMHNRALAFPGVVKDRDKKTFVKK